VGVYRDGHHAWSDQLAGLGDHSWPRPTQDDLHDGHRLRAQLFERAIAVQPRAEIDLCHDVDAPTRGDVDQQAHFDSVTDDERHLFEEPSPPRVLA